MTFAGPQLQRLLLEFGDKMGDFCGDERILAENRRLSVAWVSTQLRLYWRKEGVYASYTPLHARNIAISVGAKGEQISLISQKLAEKAEVTTDAAKKLLRALE